MLFGEDTTLRSAKKALLITSSLALLLVLAGIDLNEINGGIIKFQLARPTMFYIFIWLVLIYQSIILKIRNSQHTKVIVAEQRASINELLQEGRSPVSLQKEIQSKRKDLQGLKEKMKEWAEKESYHIYLFEDERLPTLRRKEGKLVKAREMPNEFLEMGEEHQLFQSQLTSLLIQLNDQKRKSRFIIVEKTVDYFIPMIVSALAQLAIIYYLLNGFIR